MKRSFDQISKNEDEIETFIFSQNLEEGFKLRIESCISSFLNYYNLTQDNLTRIEGEINISGNIKWKFVVNDNKKISYNFKLPLHENENEHEKMFLYYISQMNNWNDKIRLYKVD